MRCDTNSSLRCRAVPYGWSFRLHHLRRSWSLRYMSSLTRLSMRPSNRILCRILCPMILAPLRCACGRGVCLRSALSSPLRQRQHNFSHTTGWNSPSFEDKSRRLSRRLSAVDFATQLFQLQLLDVSVVALVIGVCPPLCACRLALSSFLPLHWPADSTG